MKIRIDENAWQILQREIINTYFFAIRIPFFKLTLWLEKLIYLKLLVRYGGEKNEGGNENI